MNEAARVMKATAYLTGWWRLSRAPFLLVGILPLFLGFVLAWRCGHQGAPALYILASLAVILIMWMTYYLGEWNDLEGDRINQNSNPFSGGSRVLVEGNLSPRVALLLGYGCLAGAAFLVVTIFLHYRTGPWTLPLAGIGLLAGFYYSNKPFQWSHRGIGEVLIGFCYSWLPMATGFYLVAGFFIRQLLLLSLPVGLSIFNVILINEFPDEEADRAVGKRNLVVRYGKDKMADLYLGLSVLIGLVLVKVISMVPPSPRWLFVLSGVPLLLMAWNFVRMWREDYRNPGDLHVIARNTLLVNLSITMILTLQQTLMESTAGR